MKYPGNWSLFRSDDRLLLIVFAVIVGTVVIQSLTGKAVARSLDIVSPEPTGVLVVGANPAALFYARALQAVDLNAGSQVTRS